MQETVLAVVRMQRYIEAHIGEPIDLGMLADVAGYSPYHSAHIFKELTGKSPLSYVRDMRLSQAAVRLRNHQDRVLDVALDYAFGSHEGFTRAFTRAFGIAPQSYSRKTPPIKLFVPYLVSDHAPSDPTKKEEENMDKQQEFRPIFVQVIERPQRKVLVKRGVLAEDYFGYCEEVGCDIWGMLTSVKEALYEPIGMWLPPCLIPKGTSRYVQGVEVPMDYQNEIPEGYELITLAPCRMMVFQGLPYDNVRFMEEVSAVMTYIDQFDPRPYGYAWADDEAPRFQLAPEGERGYIEARPVKPLG